jgi:PAS domain S-box-containing protein
VNSPGTNAATNARAAKDTGTRRLGLRLALGVILFSALVTGVITALELYRQYRMEVDEIARQFISIDRSMVPALAEAVWVEDPVQIRTILDGLLTLRDVESATVMVEGAKSWSAGARMSKHTLVHSLPLHRSYKGREVAIGRLEIVASVDNVYDRLLKAVLVILVGNAVKTALVVFFMVYLFRRVVGRHLERVARHVIGLTSERAAALALERDPADGPWRPDILDEVVAAVNQTNEALSAQRVQIESQVATLRESEERLRLALDAAHMGTFDWDVPGNRITWSRWHEELWGLKPGEFGGTYEAFSSRVHADDLPGINAEVGRCIAAREVFSREFRVVWPDDSTHWIAAVGEFAFDADGKPTRMHGVVVDITDRKRAEEKLGEQLHELQRWHNVMLDREDRVIDLKREVNELLARAGEPPRYPSADSNASQAPDRRKGGER